MDRLLVFNSEAVRKYFLVQINKAMGRPLGRRKVASIDVKLTRREIEILSLLSNEHNSEEIAEKLHISSHTVEAHRKNIMVKADARNIVGVINFGYRRGYIVLDR
jgi:DNA-binding CsgD family transcriptional regulator